MWKSGRGKFALLKNETSWTVRIRQTDKSYKQHYFVKLEQALEFLASAIASEEARNLEDFLFRLRQILDEFIEIVESVQKLNTNCTRG
ncbi:MAG: hypothetical protein DRH37_10380 [Deltaproteobacteria bacterium]|nr:MAG: hypothetical protein DRH37_10380 [Deltaproteobacteria bacterium]